VVGVSDVIVWIVTNGVVGVGYAVYVDGIEEEESGRVVYVVGVWGAEVEVFASGREMLLVEYCLGCFGERWAIVEVFEVVVVRRVA
jgi:hypothetical protein